MPREILVGGGRIKISKNEDEHTYYYCVNTYYNEEPIQIYGYIMAKDEEDAVRKILMREAIEDGCNYEFLELREIYE